MSEIIDNGAGTYTFRDAAALKKFLLIKDKCLGTAKKGPCKVDRKRVINALQPQLEEVVRAGFPSDTAAFELKKVACECICKNRHADVLSEHGETISQHDDLYNQWNRKLWVSYLKKNDASQGDKMKWEKVFGQLKCQSPAQTESPGSEQEPPAVDANEDHGPRRLFSMRRRVSTLSAMSLKRASSGLSTMARLQRKPTDPRPSGERLGIGAIVKEVLGFGHRDDPKPSAESRDETRNAYTAEEVSEGESPRESFESCDRASDGDYASSDVTTEPETHDRLTAPAKHRKIPVACDEYDDSPTSSTYSDTVSPLFSADDDDLGGTPDTTFSSDFDFSTPGKGPSTRENGTTGREDPVGTATPSPRNDQKEDSTKLNSAGSKASGTYRFMRRSNLDKGFKPESRCGKRASRAAGHQLETPTKSRTAPRVVASSLSKDNDDYDEGEEEEIGNGEDDDKKLWDLYTHPHVELNDAGQPDEQLHFEPKDKGQFKALRRILNRLGTGVKPLNTDAGFLYIYKQNTAPDFLKIGWSKYDARERVRRITKACGHDPTGVDFVGEQEMAMACFAMEQCVHDHLYTCHYTDCRCAVTYEERTGTGPGKKKRPCKTKHREWFRTSSGKATEVVAFWKRFNDTEPYDENGRLNRFWTEVLVGVWDVLHLWEKEEEEKELVPAFSRWESRMNDGIERWGPLSKGSPRADLTLSLDARVEGEASVSDGVETSGKALLTLPVRAIGRPRGRSV